MPSHAKAEQFFFVQAGFSYPAGSSEAGKLFAHMESAKVLARAEAWARDNDCWYQWENDPNGWDSIGDIDPDTVSQIESCTLRQGPNGVVLGSLSGIIDANRDYRRVVEAELAAEAMPTQKRRRK